MICTHEIKGICYDSRSKMKLRSVNKKVCQNCEHRTKNISDRSSQERSDRQGKGDL